MPNPPVPIEIKRRRGTLRKDRLPGGGADLATLPPMPRELAALAPLDALETILEDGRRPWWISEEVAPSVALLREALMALERAKVAGTIRDVLACLKTASRVMSELGFDPVARARHGFGVVRHE